MIANVGGQYRDNGALIVERVLHEALEAVDATEPDVKVSIAQLPDGSVVTSSLLLCCGDLYLLSARLNLRFGRLNCRVADPEGCNSCQAGQRGDCDREPITLSAYGDGASVGLCRWS